MNKVLNKDKNLTRILAVFLVCFVLFSITQGKSFLSVSSFQSMGKLFPEFGLLSIGMALALLTGGIDLSVVYVANLCSIMAALTIKAMTPEGDAGIGAILAGILVALIVGMICGSLNGLLISAVGIPAMLATLGTQSLYNGLGVVASKGSSVTGSKPLSSFVSMKVAGIPMAAIIFVLCAAVMIFIISKTTLGYKIKMMGTNMKASAFSGFNNVKLTVLNYMMIGLLSAVAGIIMLGALQLCQGGQWFLLYHAGDYDRSHGRNRSGRRQGQYPGGVRGSSDHSDGQYLAQHVSEHLGFLQTDYLGRTAAGRSAAELLHQ